MKPKLNLPVPPIPCTIEEYCKDGLPSSCQVCFNNQYLIPISLCEAHLILKNCCSEQQCVDKAIEECEKMYSGKYTEQNHGNWWAFVMKPGSKLTDVKPGVGAA
jgi:hypothetical protein